MTIELQTGLPGACKTQYTLWRVENMRRKTGRPVFYSGIPIDKAKLPDWQEIEAKDWAKCPPESIVIIDEAQRLFRPRANGSAVPDYEAALETHRHGGIDLILITQNPRLVSIGVRSLVGRHLHAVRAFGLQQSMIHEWPECRLNIQNRADSIKQRFLFKREVYGWYKSAEVHTVERRIPAKVLMLAFLPVVMLALSFFAWRSLHKREEAAKALAAAPSSAASAPAYAASGSHHGPLGITAYIESLTPRIRGLAYTAPAYDEVTKPVRAPYPAACVATPLRCQCYSQQGTRLDVPKNLCRNIAETGFFVAWDDKRAESTPVEPARTQQTDIQSPVFGEGHGGGGITLGGRSNGPVETRNTDADTGAGLARAKGQNGARPPNAGGGNG